MMAQEVRALATEPDDLRSIPGGRSESTPSNCPLTYIHVPWCACTFSLSIYKCNFKKVLLSFKAPKSCYQKASTQINHAFSGYHKN